MRFNVSLLIFPILPFMVAGVLTAKFPVYENFQIPGGANNKSVTFAYRKPLTGHVGQILLLIPGYNGSGPAMLDARWCKLADECGLILLAPTFITTPEELKKETGYYYPKLWSGKTVEGALAILHKRTGVQTDKILIFGFSAGAHFASNFALWKPGKVRAFVAYSAAWWSQPKAELARVPALIMCGEADVRYDATLQFMNEAIRLKLPWVWRSYQGTSHEITPTVRSLAEAFLRHYAGDEKTEKYYGDIQTYRVVPESERESIPEELRITLPSKSIAEIWAKEE